MNENKAEATDLVKAGTWYTISNFLVKGIAFITVPIFARLMTKNEMGYYSNIIVWMDVLSIIVGFSLPTSVNRARFDFNGQLEQYCSSILFGGTIFAIICYGIVCIFMPFFETVFSVEAVYIHMIFYYLFVHSAFEIVSICERVKYHYKNIAALSLISAILTTAVSILMVLFMENKVMARTAGLIFPMIFLSVPLYFYIMMKGRGVLRMEYIRYAFLYSWPFIPHLLSMKILNASDRIMITKMVGTEANAIYTIAYTCMSVATIFLTSLNTAVSPWVFDKLESKDTKGLKQFTLPYVALFGIILQLVMLVAPEVLLIVGGKNYLEGISCFVPLFTSIMVQFCYCLYVNVEQYARKTWAVAFGTAVAAVVNVVLNFILIPRYGYVAAAYTTLIGYLILFAVHYTIDRIIGYKNVYNDKVVFFALAFFLIQQPVLLYLYRHMIIRYFLFGLELCVMAIYLWRYKRVIFEFFKK